MLTQQENETATLTDSCMRQGALDDDDAVHLRKWGSYRIHRLPLKQEKTEKPERLFRQVDWLVPLWLLMGFLFSLVPSLAHADPDPRAKPANPVAREHFIRGNRLFRVREFDKAIAEYKAGALVEDIPVFQYNLAQSYRMLGRYEEALWHYENFSSRLPLGDPNKTKVEELMTQVKEELTKAAASKPPAEPTSGTGHRPLDKESLNLRAEPDRSASRPSNWGWGLAGSGSLLLGGSALVFHFWGDRTYERAKSTSDSSQRDALVDSANTRRYAAQGLTVATVACAGGAIYLYIRSRGASRKRSARLLPVASPQLSGISLSGDW